MLIRVCNNNSNNRNKLTMHLLNSSSITTTSNYNPVVCSRMASPAETSRTVRVRVERAPNMRTPMRRGTSNGDRPVAPPLTTVAREYPAAVDKPTRACGGVAREVTATTGGSPHAEGASRANITTLSTPPASPCPASTHKGVSSKHKSSHSLTSRR
jgi:hypothetical protein